jgi:hypothetical protein
MAKKPSNGTYTVRRSPVTHDGKTYQPGEQIKLGEADAEALIAVDAIEGAEAADEEQPQT